MIKTKLTLYINIVLVTVTNDYFMRSNGVYDFPCINKLMQNLINLQYAYMRQLVWRTLLISNAIAQKFQSPDQPLTVCLADFRRLITRLLP